MNQREDQEEDYGRCVNPLKEKRDQKEEIKEREGYSLHKTMRDEERSDREEERERGEGGGEGRAESN